MIAVIVVAALAVLALVTQAGVLLAQRVHPARGRMVEVAGGTLHILDIGPRENSGHFVRFHAVLQRKRHARARLSSRTPADGVHHDHQGAFAVSNRIVNRVGSS